MRGRTEGGSQATHCPELRIQRDKIYGDALAREEFPQQVQTVADVRLADCYCTHLGKLPRTPPLPSSEPSVSRLYTAALRSTPGKAIRCNTWPVLTAAHQAACFASCGGSAAECVYHRRPEKTIILAAGRKDLAEGKFGGFQKGEMQPLSNSATGGHQ